MTKKICNNLMNFQDCELAILRHAVDEIEAKMGRKKINNPEVEIIISIVEEFIRKRKRICYGGTAINNILPEKDQFYNKDVELPDYDFFSPSPLKDAKDLADLYYKRGFTEVQASAGVHSGTFKVFVNFMPVADITLLVPELYRNLLKTYDDGKIAQNGLKVALLGSPNSGKSSLMNCLLKEHRALVTDEAGTTDEAGATDAAAVAESDSACEVRVLLKLFPSSASTSLRRPGSSPARSGASFLAS